MIGMLKSTLGRLKKNLSVVRVELRSWWWEMLDISDRLKKPSLNPSNREHFVPHVLAGVIEETYDKLPRTLTYLTILALFCWAVWAIVT